LSFTLTSVYCNVILINLLGTLNNFMQLGSSALFTESNACLKCIN
jgi:hypothetical protein